LPRLVWTAEAFADLESIRDFIAEGSPHYGALVAAGIVEAVEHLRDFPRDGRTVPELSRSDIREVIHDTYRIVYRLNEDTGAIEILTVFRSSRRFPEL
jgi:toxin ParE1/3/4